MNYLIFDQEGEMVDMLNFDSQEKLSLFKFNNPTYIVKEENEFIGSQDDFNTDEEVDEW